MEPLTSEQQAKLVEEMQRGSFAYVRNLAATEQAVLRGQFNLAKVLRVAAYMQRTLALNAARQLEVIAAAAPATLLTTILSEQQIGSSSLDESSSQMFVQHSAIAYERLAELVQRSLASLSDHPDILEKDVAMVIHGCQNCGNVVEGSSAPPSCDLCGAIMAEFEWFGPFYSATHEHLGQLTPETVISVLQQGPQRVAGLLLGVDDALLRRKASEPEWSIKEIIGHIIESDKCCQNEAHAILDGTPFSLEVPPWEFQKGKGYQELSAENLVYRYTEERQKTLDLLQKLYPADWSKRDSRGQSLLDLGTWHGNHDVGHLAQVERLLR